MADSDWVKLGCVALGWGLGLFSKELSDWIAVFFRGPSLRIDFTDDGDCQTLTPEEFEVTLGRSAVTAQRGTRIAYFARLRVTNTKSRIAQQCRAWLVGIDELRDGVFTPTTYKDSIPLIWSYDTAMETTDIPKKVSRYVDLLRIQSDSQGFQPQLWSSDNPPLTPLMYQHIFSQNGTFRLSILVSAQDVSPVQRKIVVKWDGTWPPTARAEG